MSFHPSDKKALQALTKKELVDFILHKAIRTKREIEKRVIIQKQEAVCVHNYVQYLEQNTKGGSSGTGFSDKEQRVLDEIDSKKKQLDVILKAKADIQREADMINKPKKDALHEKIKAQNEMTPRIVKKIYKYFENNSDELPVAIIEVFIACLMGKPASKKEDVQIYLKKQ